LPVSIITAASSPASMAASASVRCRW
jgi:hypothetical protein